MEIALPLIALGSMYVISNQNSKSQNSRQPENFTNMGKNKNYLPNTNIAPQNYPVMNQLTDTIQEYPNPNTSTDKYFNQNAYQGKVNQGKHVGQNPAQVYSMSGDYVDSNQFKHNNMVPFNGGKIKGYTFDADIAETVLDSMNGNGSQIIKKIEQAPLFKPEDNVQWAYGAPNQSDFFQSRVNPGMRNNNVKPFESENVGPGLNQGYGTCGSGGFNSGMESRDSWLPKTVDQLRVDTNPKMEYNLNNLEGPANSIVKNLGLIGRVEKQHPDTFFINTQDRWLTTTGGEKAERLRPIEELGIIRRNDVLSNYKGPAGNSDHTAGLVPRNYEQSKRTAAVSCDVPHSSARGRGPATDGDRNLQSHSNYSNNRSTMKQPDSIRSGFSAAIGAVISPIMDLLRPTRKEEITHNVRIYGEAGSTVPQSYVLNPNDTTNTTIKETTIFSPNFYVNNQKNGNYINNEMPGELTQRDSTNCSYIGSSGGSAAQYGDMNYSAAYLQQNNEIKSSTINNRPNQGGTQVFNQQMNVSINKQDSDRFSGRFNAPVSNITQPPSKEKIGRLSEPQFYNEMAGANRNEPSILDNLKSNPFIFPFNSCV